MKILIAGGGTGGHVFPGIAVAEELRASHPQIQVLFIGGRQGLEAQAVPEAGFTLRTLAQIPICKAYRKDDQQNADGNTDDAHNGARRAVKHV